jgi:hypothetical protein
MLKRVTRAMVKHAGGAIQVGLCLNVILNFINSPDLNPSCIFKISF